MKVRGACGLAAPRAQRASYRRNCKGSSTTRSELFTAGARGVQGSAAQNSRVAVWCFHGDALPAVLRLRTAAPGVVLLWSSGGSVLCWSCGLSYFG